MPKGRKNKKRKANKGKILFVEDDRFLAEMFRQKFVIEGYTPIIAHTAISAVLALNQEKPLAIMLDVVLPDSECWMILEFIRRKKDFQADAFVIKCQTTPEQLVEIMEKLIKQYKRKPVKQYRQPL